MKVSASLPIEVLKMAYDSVVSHKFRSFLTILGIVVGILTAVVVASILTGMRQSIVAMFEDYGTNNIYLFHLSTGFGPSNRDERNRKPLTMEDARAILTQASAVHDVGTVAVNIGSWGTGFDDNRLPWTLRIDEPVLVALQGAQVPRSHRLSKTPGGTMRRILIIDDAATVRMYHREILEGAGYAVEEAVNGIEALEKSLQRPFELYVVDINMPKLDGYGFLRELRAQEIFQAPAIMVSTEAQANDEKRAYAAGANAYLVKPVKPEQLQIHAKLLLGEAG